MDENCFRETAFEGHVGPGELARVRQGCYRVLGALLLYPNPPRLANIAGAIEFLQDMPGAVDLWPVWGPLRRVLAALRGPSIPEMAQLEKEHVRLFRVNPEAPPYESVYTDPDRLATGLITAQLARGYLARGLQVPQCLGEPADHVAVELQFLAHLCSLEARAWDLKAADEAGDLLTSEQAFLAGHLGRWFPAMARRIRLAHREEFYVVTSEAVEAFIRHDRDLVALLLQRLQEHVGQQPEAESVCAPLAQSA
jgi:TorA maturation chaperone TorD